MKKTMLSIVMMLCCVLGYAQETPKNELPKIVPSAPNSHELGRYGNIPIGNFTGSIQPKIHLLEYKTQNLSVPISLNYSSNGIKVDQHHSNVGLGWTLNIGGVITRTVRQRPDEDRSVEIPESIYSSLNSDEAIMYLYNNAASTASADSDSQVDIFNFNFLNKTGRFVLDKNKNPVLLDYSGLKIVRTTNGFKITDENGIDYFFDVKETSRTRNQGDGHEPWSDLFITSWHLSKIVHYKGDQINLIYAPLSQTYVLGKSQTLTWYEPTAGCNGYLSGNYKHSQVISNYGNFNTYRLTKISSNNIEFGEIEVTSSSSSGVVTEINHKDKNSSVLEKLNFNYYTNPNNRLFLQNITFKNPEKKYDFEYIRANLFPERTSFSQDHWGYYNGKTNSVFYPNPSKIVNMVSPFKNRNEGANREIDFYFAEVGLLRKIIYPTKGITEFEFEGNQYYGTKNITPPKTFINLVAETNSNELQKTASATLSNIKFSQEVRIFNNLIINSSISGCDSELNNPIHREKATIEIENITNPSETPHFFRRLSTGDSFLGSSTFNITPGEPLSDVYVHLTQNNDYKITISIDGATCLRANLGVDYYRGDYTTVNTNISQGGMRIKRITNISTIGKTEIKRYYYAKKETLNQSSGVKGVTPWYVRDVNTLFNCSNGNISGNSHRVLNSSSTRGLYYNSSSFSTKYPIITISYGGDNFEQGGQEFFYETNLDSYGRILKGNQIQGSIRNNTGWNNSLLKKVNTFKKENNIIKVLKSEENFYQRDPRKNIVVKGLTIRKNYELPVVMTHPSALNIRNLEIVENSFRTNWFYLSEKIEKLFDEYGNNSVTKTSNYYYDNPIHVQQTRVEWNNSKGEVIKTETKYADDVIYTTSLGHENLSSVEKSSIDNLKLQNRIAEPIQIEDYKNNVLQSTQRTNYKTENGLTLIKNIQTSKGSNVLEDRVVYHAYDNKGNPTEVSKKDGTKIYYVWGYEQTQPIAKIEGYTAAQLASAQTAINNAISASNSDDDTCLDSESCDEKALRDKLRLLRNSFPTTSAQITTYTYDPLIGVTSITDPRGETIYYEYDDFNRLYRVKDSEGKILKENQYKYKN